ncbi:MAG: hypothetical protein ACYC6Y_08890 [Thermoguttaceae bacterium]
MKPKNAADPQKAPPDDAPISGPPRSGRRLVVSSDSYALAVLFWFFTVAAVAIVVWLVCTRFFAGYIAFLRNLTAGE